MHHVATAYASFGALLDSTLASGTAGIMPASEPFGSVDGGVLDPEPVAGDGVDSALQAHAIAHATISALRSIGYGFGDAGGGLNSGSGSFGGGGVPVPALEPP